MKALLSTTVILLLFVVLSISSCATQEKMVAEGEKAPAAQKAAAAKVKPVKAAGSIGLLDPDKSYMIVVTKKGKLITVDVDKKSKITNLIPQKGKVSDINLGERATVMYKSKGDKNTASAIEFISKATKGPALPAGRRSKGEKVSGNIGLLDLEKNYTIVVTSKGKLVTVGFNDKTKVTKFVPNKAKMSDLNLGDSATLTYLPDKEKNILQSMEVRGKAKKGK